MGILPPAQASVAFALFAGIGAFAGSRALSAVAHGWYGQATFLLTFNDWLTALFVAWGAMGYIKEQAFWGHPPSRSAATYLMEFAGLMFVVLGVAPFALHAIFRDSPFLYVSPIIGWVAYATLAGMAEQRGGNTSGHFIRGRHRVSSFRIQ